MGGDAFAAGNVTVGLASHWPRVTDTIVFIRQWAQDLEEGYEHPDALLWSNC